MVEDKVLVVDDEAGIADALAYALIREGFKVETAYDGEEALSKVLTFVPSVIILDVMMPKLSGFDVLKKLDNPSNMGIIMLTAKDDIVDKIVGLELGADDYMTKPFDVREVIARTKSLIRRLNKETGRQADQQKDKLAIGSGLEIFLANREVMLEGEELDLTPKEFDLLVLLASNPGRVYTRENLLDLIWDMDYLGGTRTVDIHIQRIRKKLGANYQQLLQTVHGVGYKAVGDWHED